MSLTDVGLAALSLQCRQLTYAIPVAPSSAHFGAHAQVTVQNAADAAFDSEIYQPSVDCPVACSG